MNCKPSKNIHQKRRQNEDFFSQTKAEQIYYQKIHTAGNPKGSFLGWSKIISDESFEVHERMKNYWVYKMLGDEFYRYK